MNDDPFWRRLAARTFPPKKARTPKDVPKGEPGSGYARVTNKSTGETKVVKVPGVEAMKRDLHRGIGKVPWCPHRCETDLDGHCQHGWPSRTLAFLL